MDIFNSKKVTHIKYGNGNIIEVIDKIFMIKFDDMEEIKKFKYPDSFDGFMTFQDLNLQEDVISLLDIEKAKRLLEKEKKKQADSIIEEEKRNERNNKLKKQRKITKAKSDREKVAKSNKEAIGEEYAIRL